VREHPIAIVEFSSQCFERQNQLTTVEPSSGHLHRAVCSHINMQWCMVWYAGSLLAPSRLQPDYYTQVGWYGQYCIIPGRGLATRPSDASTGKLVEGTATDWVTRGHLTLVIFSLQ
jgi:hypothetical protein